MPCPRLVAVDVETTGLQAHRHELVEVAAVEIDLQSGRHRLLWESMLRPRSMRASEIHGLGAHDVAQAPRWGQIAAELYQHLQGAIWVGHNMRFDYGFLRRHLQTLTPERLEHPWLCTLELDPRGGRSLARACQSWGVAGPGRAHRASEDALACARLLAAFHRNQPGLLARQLGEVDLPAPLQGLPAASAPARPRP